MTTETQSLPVTSRVSGFNWRRLAIAFAITLVLFVAVAAIAAYGYARMNDGRVLPGVSVAGVQISGLNPADAEAKLRASLPDVNAGRLVLKVGSVEQPISYSEIDRNYNLAASIDDAMSVGRDGNALDQLGQQLRTMLGGVTITPAVTYDSQALAQRVAAVVATAQVTPVNAAISFKNGEYVVSPASDGQKVDGAEALRQSIAALNSSSTDDTSVTVEAVSVNADISTPDASAAVEHAQAVTATPLILTAGSRTSTIDSQSLRGWVRLEETRPGQWTLVIAREPIDQLVGILKTQVDQPAVEAQFKFDGGQPTAVAGATGYELDAVASADAVYNALTGRAAGTLADHVTLPVATTVPDFTTTEAQALVGRVKLLGSWTTHYIPSPMNNGGQNIRRPATLIDGTVIQPGEVFDFVGVAGPITKANGYGEGAAIIHGKTKGEGVLGGGLCSASTTMFNAALRAGFELGARRNHAYYITRYPVGLDATIWISGSYTQTMSFTNDSEFPIIIRGVNHKRTVTFEIYGVPDGRTVTLSQPDITQKKPAANYYEFSDTLAPRVLKRSEYPADGFFSVVVRTVRNSSGQIIHQDTIRSSYRKVDGIILVGRYAGDPPAGTRWPVSQGIPDAPGPKPTPTPDPSNTPKPTNNPTPTPTPSHTPKPSHTPTPTPTSTPTATPTPETPTPTPETPAPDPSSNP